MSPLSAFLSRNPVTVAAAALAAALLAPPLHAATPTVAVGADFVLVSRTDGTVWAWGLGNDGQLGNGTRASSSRPVRVSGLDGVVGVWAADGMAAALKADGTVWVWGSGSNGIFGSTQPDSTIRATTPVRIPELHGIYALALGRNGAAGWAADAVGDLFHWGNNFSGQAGDGSLAGNAAVKAVPVRVPGVTDVGAIAAADDSFVAATYAGAVLGWGYNEAGGLGVTARTTRGGAPLAVQAVAGTGTVVALAAIDINDNAQFAVRRDGSVVGWGTNRASQAGCGQLGVSAATLTTPTVLNGLSAVAAVAGGNDHALFLTEDGVLLGCGSNGAGQLGDGTLTGADSAKPGPLRAALPLPAQAVGAGRNSSAAVAQDGSVWMWGQLANGAAGDGGAASGSRIQATPQAVVGEGGSGRFDAGAAAAAPALYTGTQRGALARATIDVGFSPLPADIGREARIYLAATLPDGSLYLYSDAGGWQPYAGGAVPVFRRGTLTRHVALPLYADADLSGTAGIRLLVGYGVGGSDDAAQADLLSRSTYGVALTLQP